MLMSDVIALRSWVTSNKNSAGAGVGVVARDENKNENDL